MGIMIFTQLNPKVVVRVKWDIIWETFENKLKYNHSWKGILPHFTYEEAGIERLKTLLKVPYVCDETAIHSLGAKLNDFSHFSLSFIDLWPMQDC